jgi:hypothetical protein
MTCDPLVVDSTVELDRILESGHAPPPSSHSQSLRVASPTSSISYCIIEDHGAQPHPSPRPKLTDHLRHVSFSPKRPRNAQSSASNLPTPRPARKPNAFPSYASSPAQPEVRLHPATPSTTGSKFTRMARGINKELEATQQQLVSEQQSLVDRNPFHDVANQSEPAAASFRRPTPRKSSMRDTSRGKVYLPDVTALTNAVNSPARSGTEYYSYGADHRPRDSEGKDVELNLMGSLELN